MEAPASNYSGDGTIHSVSPLGITLLAVPVFSLRLATVLGGAFYKPHFVDEATEGSDLLEMFFSHQTQSQNVNPSF